MRLKILMITSLLAVLISCSKESPENVLSNPGFGVVETQISTRKSTSDIPVLIKFDKDIKGVQFTLTWDINLAKVGQPELNDLNSGFTVSTGKGAPGSMKVLVFSMTGDVLNVSDPAFMTIPVSILNTKAESLSITFEKAVFAGPKARSYEIPINHANLRIEKS